MGFDFEAAQRELTLAERVVAGFPLGEFREEFLDTVIESFCVRFVSVGFGCGAGILCNVANNDCLDVTIQHNQRICSPTSIDFRNDPDAPPS